MQISGVAMPSQLLAKLIELAYDETRPNLDEHEKIDRLHEALLGKDLDFTTDQGAQGNISFHNIGQGKRAPSTLITLQSKGIEFTQDTQQLTLDIRYLFYHQYGHQFFFTSSTKFLITLPIIRKLGPRNILIEFLIYGDTFSRVNRCLSIFADIIRLHQADRHQKAIECYNSNEYEWDGGPKINLSGPIKETDSVNNPFEYMSSKTDDEVYIKEYVKYIRDPEGSIRETFDNRSTFAESQMK